MNVYSGGRGHLWMVERGRRWFTAGVVRWVALLALCSAYIQGGLYKATHFSGAIAEMEHFGLWPPVIMAVLVIAVELGGSALILTGRYRWLGALALAGFTFLATLMAYRFWELAPPERITVINGVFEHLGLIGGLLLVAWHDSANSGASAPDSSRLP